MADKKKASLNEIIAYWIEPNAASWLGPKARQAFADYLYNLNGKDGTAHQFGLDTHVIINKKINLAREIDGMPAPTATGYYVQSPYGMVPQVAMASLRDNVITPAEVHAYNQKNHTSVTVPDQPLKAQTFVSGEILEAIENLKKVTNAGPNKIVERAEYNTAISVNQALPTAKYENKNGR